MDTAQFRLKTKADLDRKEKECLASVIGFLKVQPDMQLRRKAFHALQVYSK